MITDEQSVALDVKHFPEILWSRCARIMVALSRAAACTDPEMATVCAREIQCQGRDLEEWLGVWKDAVENAQCWRCKICGGRVVFDGTPPGEA